tara:strand:+ start:80 stop:397 length:318 start_codon:yes stop_codon:yes gene_type:complete
MKKILSSFALLLILTSCASPTVVNVIGPNDSSMSCKELSKEIALANKYFNDAQKQKKMGTPENIGALIFFLPGMGVTMKNVEEASIAAQKRSEHLSLLKENKNCK